jgi:hypothetical protein
MAQSGYTPIQIYYSTTSGNVPTAGNLSSGELALNIPDGRLFYLNGTVQVLGWSAPVTKTADFTVAANENVLINNKSGATCVATLPAASSFTGREIKVLNYQAQLLNSASSNVVPLAGGAAGTAILAATVGKWATLVSDGTNWVIIQSN